MANVTFHSVSLMTRPGLECYSTICCNQMSLLFTTNIKISKHRKEFFFLVKIQINFTTLMKSTKANNMAKEFYVIFSIKGVYLFPYFIAFSRYWCITWSENHLGRNFIKKILKFVKTLKILRKLFCYIYIYIIKNVLILKTTVKPIRF